MEPVSVYRKVTKNGFSYQVCLPIFWVQLRKMHGKQGEPETVVLTIDPNDCSIRITETPNEENKHVEDQGKLNG